MSGKGTGRKGHLRMNIAGTEVEEILLLFFGLKI